MKIFVKVEVPDGEYCNPEKRACRQVRQVGGNKNVHYCSLSSLVLNVYKDKWRKTLECLADPSALPCGHHPDALMNGDFNDGEEWCAACEGEGRTRWS
ncbi:MAG: hypothetical protein HOJ31_10160 [Anaerolineae bacterium]|jgi:hypothetical protein|nr:hypothetical protein [Anaerolineae bacterium]